MAWNATAFSGNQHSEHFKSMHISKIIFAFAIICIWKYRLQNRNDSKDSIQQVWNVMHVAKPPPGVVFPPSDWFCKSRLCAEKHLSSTFNLIDFHVINKWSHKENHMATNKLLQIFYYILQDNSDIMLFSLEALSGTEIAFFQNTFL